MVEETKEDRRKRWVKKKKVTFWIPQRKQKAAGEKEGGRGGGSHLHETDRDWLLNSAGAGVI